MEVRLSKVAEKYLNRLSTPYKTALDKAIKGLEKEPPQGDVKQLVGRKDFRLRVGDYRVIFANKPDHRLVVKITPRGEAYKK
ncbi:MAG: type II toxin-antitoxin system RelE/ParE family toxin [Deferribacteraceae bacterium]|jgi:mRNA interferase RelE/StbE|nr:type II toxin-antitoxin system RelE/ParE family toxin [Deferribacteraceae bacterium]